MFMQAVKSYLAGLAGPEDIVGTSFRELVGYYGSLEKTLWTLLASVSGGYDWNDVSEPIHETGLAYKYYFLFYVLFVTIGLLPSILEALFQHSHKCFHGLAKIVQMGGIILQASWGYLPRDIILQAP